MNRSDICQAMVRAPLDIPPWRICGEPQPCAIHLTSATDATDTKDERRCAGPDCPFRLRLAKRDARFAASMRVIYARWQDNDSYTPLDAMRDIQRDHYTIYDRPCEPEVKE